MGSAADGVGSIDGIFWAVADTCYTVTSNATTESLSHLTELLSGCILSDEQPALRTLSPTLPHNAEPWAGV